jgi:serine/threonine-protein kinase
VLGYEVLKRLAAGSSAEAYLARQEGTQDRVILEILRPELTSDAELIKRFANEAHARQTLAHPNVIRRASTGRTSDGRLFVVTEPVEGENLSARLWSQGSLNPQDLIRIAIPLCDALAYLHHCGIVHGGVGPDNVYLSGGLEAHNPKLLDYGLAFLRGRQTDSPGGANLHGEHLAPECMLGRELDVRSDIYGMGALMYEALAGFPPFTSSSAKEILLKQRTEVPALPASCERLAPIILRCLQPDPGDRYSTALELKEALGRELEADSAEPVVEPCPPRLEPQAGDMIGSYELTALLGQGAMGRVFSARHVRLGKKVAIKLLRHEKAQDRALVERFFHEARAANQINHPHIVRIFDFVEEPLGGAERRVYFVMELLEGVSLGDVLRHEVLPIERTLRIAGQLCTALEAAHARGIVHRDVKPDNIFLLERGIDADFVKVLDFGVAKLMASPGELPVFKTLKGVVLGTPAFMSPEQAAGLPADGRADVYAVGNVLYLALSGRLPFDATNYGQLLANVVSRPPPPLPEVTAAGERIPKEIHDAVMRCLAKEPERRPQTMSALREILRRTRAVTRRHDEETTETHAPQRGRRRDRILTYAAIALVAAAAAGAAWISRKTARDSPDRARPAGPSTAPRAAPASSPTPKR